MLLAQYASKVVAVSSGSGPFPRRRCLADRVGGFLTAGSLVGHCAEYVGTRTAAAVQMSVASASVRAVPVRHTRCLLVTAAGWALEVLDIR